MFHLRYLTGFWICHWLLFHSVFSHLLPNLTYFLWRAQGHFLYIFKFIWKWRKENLDFECFVIFGLGLNDITISGQWSLFTFPPPQPLSPLKKKKASGLLMFSLECRKEPLVSLKWVKQQVAYITSDCFLPLLWCGTAVQWLQSLNPQSFTKYLGLTLVFIRNRALLTVLTGTMSTKS